MNFIDLCIKGDAFDFEIDDYVEMWHDGKAGQDQELNEFLGMNLNEYSLWATKPSILPFIIKAHKNNSTLDAGQNFEQLAMAARAKNSLEAKKIENWLKMIGKA